MLNVFNCQGNNDNLITDANARMDFLEMDFHVKVSDDVTGCRIGCVKGCKVEYK